MRAFNLQFMDFLHNGLKRRNKPDKNNKKPEHKRLRDKPKTQEEEK